MRHSKLLAVASLASTLVLGGCWLDDDDGGSSSTPAVIAATADTVTVAPGGTASLIANDTADGVAASVGASGNTTFSVVATALPTGVTVTDGTLSVAADAPPIATTFSYDLCAAQASTNCSTATVTLTVLRNVAGLLVSPEQLAVTTSAALTRAQARSRTTAHAQSARATPLATGVQATCPDVPVGYEPLVSVVVTPLRADGTPAGTAFTTDACGAFTSTVPPDVATLSIAATGSLQARTFDVTAFVGGTSLGSTLPLGATYEIASLYRLDANRIGLSVIDSLTKKAVLGLPASLVTAKIDGAATTLADFASSLNATLSSTGLVMDASGSMGTTVFTDTTTGKSFDRFSLASIAAGEFISGKQSIDEVAIVIFDDTSTLIDDAYLANLSFTDATSGAAVPVVTATDGFTTDASALLTVANLYNGDSAIYARCYSSGVLSDSCFDYLANSDSSIRLSSGYAWGGSTALWAATDLALEELNVRTSSRKFIVAMTDGQDNASGANTADTVIAKAKQYGVPVWMVAFGSAGAVNETAMQKVANDTGGSYYRQESQGIVGIFQAIQTGIRFQYSATLGVPSLTTGQVITVTVDTATRDLTVP